MKQIFACPYELKGRCYNRFGALLKVIFDDGICGFADCHPWTELGDLSLAKQLELLQSGAATNLTARSLHYAFIDGQARAARISLFDTLTIPESHFLIADITKWDCKDIESLQTQGFTHFKIKLGNSLQNELYHLKKLADSFKYSKIRLDFNLKLTYQAFEKVFEELYPFKEFIDFIEDPFPYSNNLWASLQKKGSPSLAWDHGSENTVDDQIIYVVKPAVQDIAIFRGIADVISRLIVTSYLDHPLGQFCAAYAAAKFYQEFPLFTDICGLLSHLNYETNPFSANIKSKGPVLPPSEGTGFGFDDLLDRQQWVRIK